MNKKQWAMFIEKGLKRDLYRQSANSYEKVLRYLYRHKLFPIILGLTACIIYVNIWGFKELFKSVITYIIIFTILATLITSIVNPKK